MNKKHIFLTALALCGATTLVEAKDKKHKTGTYSYTPGTRYYTGTTTPVTQPRPATTSSSSASGRRSSVNTKGTCTYRTGKKNQKTTKTTTQKKCSRKGGTWKARS